MSTFKRRKWFRNLRKAIADEPITFTELVEGAGGITGLRGHAKAKRVGAWPPRVAPLQFIDSASTTDSNTITIPSSALAGDVAVLFDSAVEAPATPTGWTSITSTSDTFDLSVSYKILASGDPGSTVTGIVETATSYTLKQMLVFRFPTSISSVSISSLNNSGMITGIPSAQTINTVSAGTPVVAIGMTRAYQSEPFIDETWGTELFISEDNGNNMKVYYELQGTTATNRTVTTTADYGSYNHTVSFALTAS